MIFFARSEFCLIKFGAELCTKIAIKTCKIWKNLVKLCLNLEKVPFFASFAYKSFNFAQILENFAQTCVRASVRFRSSGVMCHMSHVTFHMSNVVFFIPFYSFFKPSGEASRWRICYQRGLTHLVLTYPNMTENVLLLNWVCRTCFLILGVKYFW